MLCTRSVCRYIYTSWLHSDCSTLSVSPSYTGEILCTIHSRVFEEHQKELQPGAAIILRQVCDYKVDINWSMFGYNISLIHSPFIFLDQVSLFSPAPRKHYLNITPDNIIRIYPPEPSYSIPQGPLVSPSLEAIQDSVCTVFTRRHVYTTRNRIAGKY